MRSSPAPSISFARALLNRAPGAYGCVIASMVLESFLFLLQAALVCVVREGVERAHPAMLQCVCQVRRERERACAMLSMLKRYVWSTFEAAFGS